MIFPEGVLKDRSALEQMVAMTSANAAEIFPIATIRRGVIVWGHGEIPGQPGSGEFIPGAKFQCPVSSSGQSRCLSPRGPSWRRRNPARRLHLQKAERPIIGLMRY